MIEEWVEWEGGEMPVHPKTIVEVDYGDLNWDGRADGFDWSAKTDGIARYRIVEYSVEDICANWRPLPTN